MKVKVSKRDLIERVKASRRDQLRKHAERVATYPAERDAYRVAVVEGLRRELRRVEQGGTLPHAYSGWFGRRDRQVTGVVVEVGSMPPSKPVRPKLTKHAARLHELKLTTADELTIDPWSNDWRSVLAPGLSE